MRIAVLSDVRYPTSVTFGGHGLGRSVARLSTALAGLGHTVTVYAAAGSYIKNCNLIVSSDEGDLLKLEVERNLSNHDAIIDSTHLFKTMYHLPNFPTIAKICDMEGVAPRNKVYGTRYHAQLHGDLNGVIVPEGLDIDEIPFNGAPDRSNELVTFGLRVEWKRFDLMVRVAELANYPLTIYGDGQTKVYNYSGVQQKGATAPPEYYSILMNSRAIIGAVSSMSLIEAAACGTPALSLVDDEFVENGITGYHCATVEDMAVAARFLIGGLNKHRMREWVAEERSARKMACEYEKMLSKAINGEIW